MLMPLVSKGDSKAYRINENESKIFGDDKGGWDFDKKCEQGSYVERFFTRGGAIVDSIDIGCSNGNNDWKWPGNVGDKKAGTPAWNSCNKKYNSVTVKYGWNGIGQLRPICDGKEQQESGWASWWGSGDNSETFNCPWGQFIYGVSGNVKDNRIQRVRFHCANEAPTAYPTPVPSPMPTIPTANPTVKPTST
jgi:hypothetical protein